MSIDLTALTATAVASVKIEHEDWCCAVGCACYPVRHAGTEADCSCLRVSIVAAARAAVEAAAPLIEAAVRAEIAREIEEAAPPWRGSFAGPGQNPVDMASMDGELHGYIAAARIARGEA